MKTLFYETITGAQKEIKKVNPLHKVYGTTPGRKCGECEHHYFKERGNKYPKCDLRKNGCTQKSDHSSRFEACGKFVEKLSL